MKAALQFVRGLDEAALLADCARVQVDLYGSLGATGAGHGSPKAIILGLAGETPEGVDVDSIAGRISTVRDTGQLTLLGNH